LGLMNIASQRLGMPVSSVDVIQDLSNAH
jgi:hypothetical protein